MKPGARSEAHHPGVLKAPDRIALILAGIVLALGSLVLLGWVLDIGALTNVVPTFVSMKFNTALGFVLSGVGMIATLVKGRSLWTQAATFASCLLLLILGSLTFIQDLFALKLGIDGFLLQEKPRGLHSGSDGRMAPFSAVSFIAIALALIAMNFNRPRTMQVLALIPFLVGLLNLVSYGYAGKAFYILGPDFTHMAIHTALGFTLLGVATLLSHPTGEVMSLLNNPGPAGTLLRRLVPVTITAALVFGFLGVYGESQGWLDQYRGMVAAIVTLLVLMLGILWHGARIVRRVDEERAAAMSTVQESEEQFRATFEQAMVGIAHVSREGRFLRVNARFCSIVGYSESELISMNFADITYSEDLPEDEANAARLLSGEIATYTVEKRYVRKDHSLVWVELTGSILRDEQGQFKYFIGVVQDISTRKAAEAQLKKLRDTLEKQVDLRTMELTETVARLENEVEARRRAEKAAERANQAKSLFLANMSHEIRTPLSVILGYAGFLGKPALSEEERLKYAQKVSRNGEALLALINDILDVSKVESGEFAVDLAPFDLGELLQDMLSTMQAKSEEKGVKLIFHLLSDLPATVVSDPLRVRQILLNVISNAIKFTEKGFVDVTLSWRDSDSQPRLEVTVTDTGIGIPVAEQSRLFQPFVQVHNGAKRFGGTGLGLFLSRQLARKLGGDLALLHSSARGSVFFLTFAAPRQGDAMISQKRLDQETQPLAVVSPHSNRPLLAGTHVLVAEDFEDSQRLFRTLIESEGGRVTIAANGAEAVKLGLDGNFNIILMDLTMPVMDGLEATRSLRRAGFRGPIVALTAHAMPEEKQRAMNGDFDDYVSKPIQPMDFIAMIRKHARSQQSQSEAAQVSLSPNSRT